MTRWGAATGNLLAAYRRRLIDRYRPASVNQNNGIACTRHQNVGTERRFPQLNKPGMRLQFESGQGSLLRIPETFDRRSTCSYIGQTEGAISLLRRVPSVSPSRQTPQRVGRLGRSNSVWWKKRVPAESGVFRI